MKRPHLSLILDAPIPRLVFFDAECIYEETKYAELLRAFALATQGEWVIEDASSTFLLGEHFREFGAQITFKTQGRRPIWTFEQSSKWVQGAFYDRVNAFTVRRFGKVFLQLPTYDQCYCGVYLARAAADALEAIFAADEAAHADEVRRRYRVLWYA